MLLGVGKAKIQFPEDFFPVENFEGVHDDLSVRVMLFQSDCPFAVLSFEATSLRTYAMDRFRREASEITGIPEEKIWVCVTHTFSAPHLRSEEALAREGGEVARKNDSLLQALSRALETALLTAMAESVDVQMACGHTICSVNVNRDLATSEGWWIGSNDLGDSDNTVAFIRFDDREGKTRAILFNYDVQSSIMDHSKGLVTGDLAGAASRFIEEQYGEDFVALFLLGAAGDQAPIFKANHNIIGRGGAILGEDIGEDGFVLVNALGKKLGAQVLQAAETAKYSIGEEKSRFRSTSVCCPGQKIAASLQEIHPTKKYEYGKDEDRTVPMSLFALGPAALVGVGPELSSSTAIDIRKESPYPVTMIVTMVNGIDKYMPEQTAYDRITYEAMNSKYARGSAEMVQKELIRQLKEMKGEEL